VRYLALVVLVAVAACEDTRRASRRDRYEESGQSYGGRVRRDDDGLQRKLDDIQGKLGDLQGQLAAPATLGAYECDELIRLMRCSYDKAGTAIDDTARKALEDGLTMWKQALDSPTTRQTTIDACKLSLDAGRSGWASMGCY